MQSHSADTAAAAGKLIAAGGDYTAANLTDEERKAIGFALDPVGASGVRLSRQRDINTLLRLIEAELPKPIADATFPSGSLRNSMDVKQGSNDPEIIGNTPYSGHSLDQMQGRGIPLSIVKNVIEIGEIFPTLA